MQRDQPFGDAGAECSGEVGAAFGPVQTWAGECSAPVAQPGHVDAELLESGLSGVGEAVGVVGGLKESLVGQGVGEGDAEGARRGGRSRCGRAGSPGRD